MLQAVDEIRAAVNRLTLSPGGGELRDRREVINLLAAGRHVEHLCWEWSGTRAGPHPHVHGRLVRVLRVLAGMVPDLRTAVSQEDARGLRESQEAIARTAERVEDLAVELEDLRVRVRRSTAVSVPLAEAPRSRDDTRR